MACAGLGHRVRQPDVNTLEVAMQGADQIDNCILTANQPIELSAIMNIGGDYIDRRQHQQMTCPLAISGRDGDGDTMASQLFGNRRANKTGSPEQQNPFHVAVSFRGTYRVAADAGATADGASTLIRLLLPCASSRPGTMPIICFRLIREPPA